MHTALADLEAARARWQEVHERQLRGAIEIVKGETRVFVPPEAHKTPGVFAIATAEVRRLFNEYAISFDICP